MRLTVKEREQYIKYILDIYPNWNPAKVRAYTNPQLVAIYLRTKRWRETLSDKERLAHHMKRKGTIPNGQLLLF